MLCHVKANVVHLRLHLNTLFHVEVGSLVCVLPDVIKWIWLSLCTCQTIIIWQLVHTHTLASTRTHTTHAEEMGLGSAKGNLVSSAQAGWHLGITCLFVHPSHIVSVCFSSCSMEHFSVFYNVLSYKLSNMTSTVLVLSAFRLYVTVYFSVLFCFTVNFPFFHISCYCRFLLFTFCSTIYFLHLSVIAGFLSSQIVLI